MKKDFTWISQRMIVADRGSSNIVGGRTEHGTSKKHGSRKMTTDILLEI
jgi:hypothetical protein